MSTNYFISGFSVGICSLLDGNVRSMGFWGYCTIDFKKGECPLNKTLYRFRCMGILQGIWVHSGTRFDRLDGAPSDQCWRRETSVRDRARSHAGPHTAGLSAPK